MPIFRCKNFTFQKHKNLFPKSKKCPSNFSSVQQKGNYQITTTTAWKYIFVHNNLEVKYNSNISRKKIF